MKGTKGLAMFHSKISGLKFWFSKLHYSAPSNTSGAGPPSSHEGYEGMGSFANAHDFVMNNPTFYNGSDKATAAMKALSRRAIEGAEYDSSARDPPPQCHLGTRVQLLKELSGWFYDKHREKSLLWLGGPAGVGKSAVIQTLAETLAETGFLGATLFFSRLNDRKDPQRVVATISFQLALRIPAYQAYITERIASDPTLLKKGMKDQFEIFITIPFGSRGIAKGKGPWGILLDGLDECDDPDQQCNIVQLVSRFVLDHPHAPLLWAIASRPEPHIERTFTSEAVAHSYWSEYIDIHSDEGCKDVERYLNMSFKDMRARFPHVPSRWPKETQFLKLANGALGLFVFAKTAVRFMEDPDHADPVSRLDLLLSIIDHLVVEVSNEHPFALLDALYTQILTSVPSDMWPTTKRILGFFICSQPGSPWYGPAYPDHLDSLGEYPSPSESGRSESSQYYSSDNHREPRPHRHNHSTNKELPSHPGPTLSVPSRSEPPYYRDYDRVREQPHSHSRHRSNRNDYPPSSGHNRGHGVPPYHYSDYNRVEGSHLYSHGASAQNETSSSEFNIPGHSHNKSSRSRNRGSPYRSESPSSSEPSGNHSMYSHRHDHNSRNDSVYTVGRASPARSGSPHSGSHHPPDTPIESLYSLNSRSFMAAYIILGIEHNVAHSSLHKLHSVLGIPGPGHAHKSGVLVLHASFADYLTDKTRSKKFLIRRETSVDDIINGFGRLYLEKPWDNKWAPYSSHLSRILGRNFYQQLRQDAETGLYHAVTGDLRSARGKGPFRSKRDRSERLDILGKINVADICWSGYHGDLFIRWFFKLWERYPDELRRKGIIKEVKLGNLDVNSLNYGGKKNVRAFSITGTSALDSEKSFRGFSKTFQEFKAEFRPLLQQCPGKPVLVCGGTPEIRNVFIHHKAIREKIYYTEGYYCVPYPHV